VLHHAATLELFLDEFARLGIVGVRIDVGGHHGAAVIGERDLAGRQIVQRAKGDALELLSGLEEREAGN
jgi:hypothetical protein